MWAMKLTRSGGEHAVGYELHGEEEGHSATVARPCCGNE